MAINIRQIQVTGDHHHLNMIEQLGDLFGSALSTFVLSSHPHLAGFLNHFLANGMNTTIKLPNGSGVGIPTCRFFLSARRKALQKIS